MSESEFSNDYQAWLLAHHYSFAPFDPLNYERIGPTDGIASHFFANIPNTVLVFVQYQADKIGKYGITGDPCTCCWSAGKLWEDETVPRYVFCALSGFQPPVEFLNTVFEPGEPIKMGVYVLEQKNCPDCTYELLDSEKEIIWTPDDTESTFVVTTKPDNIIRMNAAAGGCFKLFSENSRWAEINYG